MSFAMIAFGLFAIFDGISSRAQANAELKVAIEAPEQEKMITAWRAKQNIKRGDYITKALFMRVPMAESDAMQLGISGDVTLNIQNDTLANQDIKQSTWVLPEHMSNPEDAGYLDLLATEGMILYPITISTKNLINNYIRPGDYIDIVSVSSPSSNLSDPKTEIKNFQGIKAKTIKRAVKVLAFEQDPIDDVQKQASNQMPTQSSTTTKASISPRVAASGALQTTVVIEIEPEFISKLSLAQRTMHLEIYRSHQHTEIPTASVGDVIENYQGIRELRGKESQTIVSKGVY